MRHLARISNLLLHPSPERLDRRIVPAACPSRHWLACPKPPGPVSAGTGGTADALVMHARMPSGSPVSFSWPQAPGTSRSSMELGATWASTMPASQPIAPERWLDPSRPGRQAISAEMALGGCPRRNCLLAALAATSGSPSAPMGRQGFFFLRLGAGPCLRAMRCTFLRLIAAPCLRRRQSTAWRLPFSKPRQPYAAPARPSAPRPAFELYLYLGHAMPQN